MITELFQWLLLTFAAGFCLGVVLALRYLATEGHPPGNMCIHCNNHGLPCNHWPPTTGDGKG